jgi:hypothetical protein
MHAGGRSEAFEAWVQERKGLGPHAKRATPDVRNPGRGILNAPGRVKTVRLDIRIAAGAYPTRRREPLPSARIVHNSSMISDISSIAASHAARAPVTGDRLRAK